MAIYSGNFKHGNYDGMGKKVERNHIYKGEFKNGLYHGAGEKSSLKIKANNKIIFRYKGLFKNGEMHGKGRCHQTLWNTQSKEFNCEFYKNALVGIDGISLLPPRADKHKHF